MPVTVTPAPQNSTYDSVQRSGQPYAPARSRQPYLWLLSRKTKTPAAFARSRDKNEIFPRITRDIFATVVGLNVTIKNRNR
jgi:hypothetical protein